MNILIMGGPGAGKGTMSEKIVEEYKINHISTGDIFRSEIGKQTELGMKAKGYMDQGLLVPDEVTNAMVKSYLEMLDNKNGFLLDGYPRTIDQAKAFDEMSKGTSLVIDKVLALDISLDELTARVTGRRLCRGCSEIYHVTNKPSQKEGICDKCGGELYQRKDDTVESLKVRLEEYRTSTMPVLEYYRKQGLVSVIDASQSIEDVWNDTRKALEAEV